MSYKIFLSHNHNDKPLVEAVAMQLAKIFGQDQVFYDSWSIRPGDSIIEKMNSGLEAPEFVFFFVSRSSLDSGMVRLEWQNALYSASSGKTRIIPVRIDNSDMPQVLKQTLFIDMHTVGLEAAIAQIVSVTQGGASFTPQHEGFSNLSYQRSDNTDGSIDIVIRASHLMEPNPQFLMVIRNSEGEVFCHIKGSAAAFSGFMPDCCELVGGGKANGLSIRPLGGALTPSYPVRIELKPQTDAKIELLDVFHQKGETEWVSVPRTWPGAVTVSVQ